MLDYSTAVSTLNDICAEKLSNIDNFVTKIINHLRAIIKNPQLSLLEKKDLLLNRNLNDILSKNRIFQAIREDIATFTYKLAQDVERTDIVSAKKYYLVSALFENQHAKEKLCKRDNQFPELHLHMQFIFQSEVKNQIFHDVMGFAWIYFAFYDIAQFLERNSKDEGYDQLIQQQDFLEILYKIQESTISSLQTLVIHFNMSAKYRRLRGPQPAPFLSGKSHSGHLSPLSSSNHKYQALRERIITLARLYGDRSLYHAMRQFNSYLQRTDSFISLLRTEHANFLKTLPIIHKVTDSSQIRYLTTSYAELWKRFDIPGFVPPVAKPYTYEEWANFISQDLPRTMFLGHQENEFEIFQKKWKEPKSLFYLQGDMCGGGFVNWLFFTLSEMKLIPPSTDRNFEAFSFGYVNELGEVSGINIAYTRNLNEQQAWCLTIMQNANAHPEHIKVHVLTNILNECIPGYEDAPNYKSSMVPKILEQYPRSEMVTHFLKAILSESGEVNLKYLDQLRKSSSDTQQTSGFYLDGVRIKSSPEDFTKRESTRTQAAPQ